VYLPFGKSARSNKGFEEQPYMSELRAATIRLQESMEKTLAIIKRPSRLFSRKSHPRILFKKTLQGLPYHSHSKKMHQLIFPVEQISEKLTTTYLLHLHGDNKKI
jgi:hypothetical protein